MIIRNYEEIEKFVRKHANARPAFNRWRRIAQAASWEDIEDVKQDFLSADKYRACTIFDVADNNYRLITKIDYTVQIVAIRKALTHAEYDKEKWKSDCNQN
jgi:mRNA interferase HigB